MTSLDSCPGCLYVRGVNHAGDPDAPDDAPAFPCDGTYWRKAAADERAATIAKYAVGSTCTGFAGYAPHGEFVVTKAVVGTKPPAWWKGRRFEATWDRLESEGWSHDSARLYRALTEFDEPEEFVFYEFRVVEKAEPMLFNPVPA